MTAEGQSDKLASDMEVRMKQRCVIEFLHAENIAPNEIGCNALEAMVATLEYCKVWARWVPRMLKQEHKEHHVQVC